MKKILLVLQTLLLFSPYCLLAQNWVNGGNALGANGSLGTNTNYSVLFKTNNVERARITNAGLVGIGITSPASKLHLNSASGQHPFRADIAGKVKFLVHSNGGVSIGSGVRPPSNGLYVSGHVGIGTVAPEQKLHVVGNEILSTGFQAGFKFRNRGSATNADDWVWYSQNNIARFWRAGFGDLLGITTTGSLGLGTLLPARKLEIVGSQRFNAVFGTTYLEFFKPGTDHDASDWRFEHSGYSLYINSSESDFANFTTIARIGGELDLYKFTVFGDALAWGGTWKTSDQKFKKDITTIPDAMSLINQLKPRTYYFKATDYPGLKLSEKKQYGFIAQELEKVIPELVATTTELISQNQTGERQPVEVKAINYTELIPVMVKALQEQQVRLQEQQQKMQEQQVQLQEQQVQLQEQQQQIQALHQSLDRLTAGQTGKAPATTTGIADSPLQQNTPNPAINTTSISYQVPANAKTARLVITDLNGKVVKTIQLPSLGAGQVNLQTQNLSNGVYHYALEVDGSTIMSKKMIVVK